MERGFHCQNEHVRLGLLQDTQGQPSTQQPSTQQLQGQRLPDMHRGSGHIQAQNTRSRWVLGVKLSPAQAPYFLPKGSRLKPSAESGLVSPKKPQTWSSPASAGGEEGQGRENHPPQPTYFSQEHPYLYSPITILPTCLGHLVIGLIDLPAQLACANQSLAFGCRFIHWERARGLGALWRR